MAGLRLWLRSGDARWFLVLVWVVGLATSASACRIRSPRKAWVESFGEVQVHDLAAWPWGVVGIGNSTHVYHYPGHFNAPWPELLSSSTNHIAASETSVYALLHSGKIERKTWHGSAVTLPGLPDTAFEMIAADEDDRVWGLSGGKLVRVAPSVQPEPCVQGGINAAASHGVVFVVKADGTVTRVEGGACSREPTPDGVTWMAVRDGRATVVARGVAWDRRADGSYEPLPGLTVLRGGERRAVDIAQVARSKYFLWARDVEGHVFVLSEP